MTVALARDSIPDAQSIGSFGAKSGGPTTKTAERCY